MEKKDEKKVYIITETTKSYNGMVVVENEAYATIELARKGFMRKVEDFEASDLSLICKVSVNYDELIFNAIDGNFNEYSWSVQGLCIRESSEGREEEEL